MERPARYLQLLVISTFWGEFMSFYGGVDVVVRGIILGVSVAAALPLIDVFLVAKGRDAVWKAALIGGGCGLIGGVIMVVLQYLNPDWNDGVMNRSTAALLLMPSVYGVLVHAVYSFSRCRGYGLLRTANGLVAAVFVAGLVRLYPLYWPMWNGAAVPEGVILALKGSLGTTAFFTLLWGVGVGLIEGQKITWRKDGLVLTLEAVVFVIAAVMGFMALGAGYERMVFEHRTAAAGVLRSLPEAVMAGDQLVTADNRITLPADYRGQRAFLLAARRRAVVVYNVAERMIEVRRGDGTLLLAFDDYVVVALSPSGTRLAVLSSRNERYPRWFERVTLYHLPDGGKIGETTGVFDGKCCWSRDEKSLFLEHYNDNADAVPRVEKLVVATGKIAPFATGKNPDLILDDGKIAYRRGKAVYCRTPEGGPEQRLCRLDFKRPRFYRDGFFAVSPDGKMVVYTTSINSSLDMCYYVLYDLTSGRKCRLKTGTDWPLALQWLRPEDYDTAVTFAFGNDKGKEK
ncbi:MAG: hypothetical protein PHQ27_06780 [Victivallales bacterium]|nr:hypothetical protein [Victivallales bacterium]